MEKHTPTDYPIHPLLEKRWNNRAFDPHPVEHPRLKSLFEAARWAPSSMNNQPWRFVVGEKNDAAYEAMSEAMMEANRQWAAQAPFLVLVAAHTRYENGNPNPTALYEVGQAVAYFTLQAVSMGLTAAQLGGFDSNRLMEMLKLPPEDLPVAMLAVGIPGPQDVLTDGVAMRNQAPRMRKPLEAFVFGAPWGTPAPLLTK